MGSLNDLLDLYQANLTFYKLPGGPGPSKDTTGGGTRGADPDDVPARVRLRARAPANTLGRVLCEPSSTNGITAISCGRRRA